MKRNEQAGAASGASSSNPDGQARLLAWTAALLLAVMAAAVYFPVTGNGFIWDDDHYVEENSTLRSAAGLEQIWFELGATPQYYPLVHTSYWLEYRLWELDPTGYHIVNVLLHVLAALLLWRLLRYLKIPGGWFAAALFLLHPVQVESVAWVTERKNVLSGVFYLGAALAYLRFALPQAREGRDEAPRHEMYALALFLFVCALLSKTVVCSLPAALLLILWWKRGRIGWADVRPLTPFFGAGMALGLVTVWMEKTRVGATGVEWDFSWIERCLIAGRAFWFYLGKLAWPAELTFIYPRWELDAGAWWQYAFPLAALALVAALWIARHRIGRGPLVAVLFFGGTLTPALGFFDVYPMRYSFVADHFQYLATLGPLVLFAALATLAAGKIGERIPRVAPVAAALLLATLGGLTWAQTHAYRNLETLWRDTLAKNPNAWIAHNNLAIVLRSQDKLHEAAAHYREAIRLVPHNPEPYYNLGNVLSARGEVDEAIDAYRSAIDIKPEYADAHSNLGSALQTSGRIERAIEHYERALQLTPRSVETRYNLATALHSQGAVERAIPHYRKLLKEQPGSFDTRYRLGLALQGAGRTDEAIEIYRASLQLRPDIAELHYVLALALKESGGTAPALEHLAEAIRLKPDWPVALNDLAWALATDPDPRIRRADRAIRLAERAAELTGKENPSVLDTLAASYAAAGQFSRAVETAETALDLAADARAEELVESIRRRLTLYRQKQPVRESA